MLDSENESAPLGLQGLFAPFAATKATSAKLNDTIGIIIRAILYGEQLYASRCHLNMQ